MTWHLLDASSIWIKEFGAALSRQVPTTCWSPVMRSAGILEGWQRERHISNPELTLQLFPLQRGYARWPVSVLSRLGPRVVSMLSRRDPDPSRSPLICTTPFYAPVAEQWPGPVVYYQTDLTEKYEGMDPVQIRALDRRLCQIARIVCPNSSRIADYMIGKAGCAPSKITVVPNATRESNVFPACPAGPSPLPVDIADMQRPIAGIIGNLAANMDWQFLKALVQRTPEFSWVFVGPTSMGVPEPDQAQARAFLMHMGGKVRFTGAKPYGALRDYARAFDVAVLPYRQKEPTFSGSSTRFYEHLAACRPMVANLGFEELLHKEPLLRLAESSKDAAEEMETMRRYGFKDGYEQMRWNASKLGTWEHRAATVVAALQHAGVPQDETEALETERFESNAVHANQ